ncbi:MAG: phosphoenolpyruvate--protein phosphotransferase [Spirochaetaceae bacterium]|nr:MAG: phosphoenolpyruvate--protein phosphotransferase [Spirochaetaceae bacterium]
MSLVVKSSTVRKNTVDLIWSIGELSSLFEHSTNVGGFLQDVVDRIARHMESDVCSIYLFDEKDDQLVLRATRGLKPDSVGKVRLSLGEGITGSALKELRPIREAHAEKNPHFKSIPGIDEEKYRSFLAVPIKRGLSRIGVMVLQHRRADYFTIEDTRAIQAIASHLAATLENAEILMELHRVDYGPEKERGAVEPIHGTVSSAGIAIGTAVGIRTVGEGGESVGYDTTSEAREAYESALGKTRSQLERLQNEAGDRLADVASLIFSSHLLMLKDGSFTGKMQSKIDDGVSPGQAVRAVVHEYVTLFSRSTNPRVREKTQDVEDLGHRILRNLEGAADADGDYRGQIVVARNIFPSELLKIALQHVEGVVLNEGGVTAHISILARSLEVPLILVGESNLSEIPDGTLLVLDGEHGMVFVHPSEELIERYSEILATRTRVLATPAAIPDRTATADAVPIEVHANINILRDVEHAIHVKAEGIGLYRSEFPFIVRNDFPSEEEQYRIYRRIVKEMNGKEVTLRTLDVGGDKLLPNDSNNESNPFLGLRGIRFSLSHPDIFRDQLRAMLRAGAGTRLRIMLPMVSSKDEFLATRELIRECSEQLSSDGVAHNTSPELGTMIELPAAVEAAETLAATSDFLSIGTNDLVMYLLAVDRTNEHVGKMYKHHHPSVLHALKRIVAAARANDKDVSICGDAASDESLFPFLVGIGLRKFSVEPRNVPVLKREVLKIDTREASKTAEKLLSFTTIREIETYLNI